MKSFHRNAAAAAGVVALIAACAACSPESMVYGSSGASVRAITNDLIEDVQSTGESDAVCADAELDLGNPDDWDGLAAGEPERFTREQWAEYAALEPSWYVNVSGAGEKTDSGERAEVPAFLFYRGDEDDLCLAGVEWGERVSS